jgi:ketosteroid isomerase-like protein
MFRSIAHRYFQAFARKDVNSLRAMFAPDVSLRDWDIYAEGIEAVILANSKIFNALETIVVNPVNIFSDGKTVIAELIITVDHGKPLKVVDILEFTEDGKIRAIRAFKG